MKKFLEILISHKKTINFTMASSQIKSVLITDDVNEKCVQILENNDLRVLKNTKLTKEELLNEVKVIN